MSELCSVFHGVRVMGSEIVTAISTSRVPSINSFTKFLNSRNGFGCLVILMLSFDPLVTNSCVLTDGMAFKAVHRTGAFFAVPRFLDR